MAAAVLAVTVFAACSKYDDSGIKKELGDLKESITALQAAINALKTQCDAGAMIESITPITEGSGGWRITFTGGTTSAIDVMNGAEGVSAPDILPVTPRIEVREGEDGAITLWYNVGEGWIDTGVNIRGPQGAPGNTGDDGDTGLPGPPGAPGVSPQVRVITNGDNTITIQYNTGSGWVDAGESIAVGNPDDKTAISSIIDHGETVTITVIKDGEPIEYTFEKASGTAEVSRIELVGFNEKVTIAHGETEEIRIRINPSTADVTGTWSLDQTGTRASYVTAPTNFELVSVEKDVEEDSELTGQYVATIRCTATTDDIDTEIEEYAMALVLNTGTEEEPVLVSSPTFVLEAVIAQGLAGTLRWILHEDGMMTVTGKGAMPDNYVYLTDRPWNDHISMIEKVVIGDGVTTVGRVAFKDCKTLKEVIIPNSVTTVGTSAFEGCSALTKVTLPAGVTTIGRTTFGYCTSLTEINIPADVTKLTTVFVNCTSLKEIIIPADVTSIGIGTFQGCSALKKVTCLATTPPALDGSNFYAHTSDTLYVPAGSVQKYKDNPVWSSRFEGGIFPIP
jgi:hypothetical protein